MFLAKSICQEALSLQYIMVKIGSELKSALVSLSVALLVVLLTNYLYYQPYLELLSQQINAPQISISLIPGDGWTAIDTKACAIVRENTLFVFEITNVGRRSLHVIRLIINATNWDDEIIRDLSRDWPPLEPSDLIRITFRWTPELTSKGTQAELSLNVVTVELPVYTTRFWVAYL